MFEGNWSYGDPRDQQTVREHRQKKERALRAEGSIHTNSSGDTGPSLYRPLTPSGFFSGGASKRQNAPRVEKQSSLARLRSPARSNSGAKTKNQGALVCKGDQTIAISSSAERNTLGLPTGSSGLPKLLTSGTSKQTITLSPKAKSVFGAVFGKRLRHERKPSINEIIPVGAFGDTARILSNAPTQLVTQPSNTSRTNALIRAAEVNPNGSRSPRERSPKDHSPQLADGSSSSRMKVLSPTNKGTYTTSDPMEPSLDSFPMPRSNSQLGRSTILRPSGEEQVRGQSAPLGPPPTVPVPPTPDSKVHKRSVECGSFSDGSTLVTPNRRSEIPSERADSPTPRKFTPEDLAMRPVYPAFEQLKIGGRKPIQDDTLGSKRLPGTSSTYDEDYNASRYFGSPQRGGSHHTKPTNQGRHTKYEHDDVFKREPRSHSPPTFLNYGGNSRNTSLPFQHEDDTSERVYAGSNKSKDHDVLNINSYRTSISGNRNARERVLGYPNDAYDDDIDVDCGDWQGPAFLTAPRPSSRTAGNAKKQNGETSPIVRKSFQWQYNRMENAGLRIVFKRLMEDWPIDPNASIDEQIEMKADLEFEKQIWSIIGTRWLTFGRILVSPGYKVLNNAKLDDGKRILSLQGSTADGWALAATFPGATVYSASSQNLSKPNCGWSAPPNHHTVFMPLVTTTIPFSDEFFDVVVTKTITSLYSDGMWEAVLRDCHRVLRPDGWLEIQTMEPALNCPGESLKKWTDTKLLVELMDEEMSITPVNDLAEFIPSLGFGEIKRSRIQLQSVIKKTSRGNSPAIQRDADTNKLSVFVGRHIYEELYAGFLPKDKDTGEAGKLWWLNNRHVKGECESKDSTFELNNIFTQKV